MFTTNRGKAGTWQLYVNHTDVVLADIYPAVLHSKKTVKDRSWAAATKQCLGNIKEYIEYLKEIKVQVDKSADLSVQMKEVRPLLALEHFNVEIIKGKNSAAAGLTGFVINIVIYYDVVSMVEPKKKLVRDSIAQLDAAQNQLADVKAKVKALEEKLQQLMIELNEANAIKAAAEATAARPSPAARCRTTWASPRRCRSWRRRARKRERGMRFRGQSVGQRRGGLGARAPRWRAR